MALGYLKSSVLVSFVTIIALFFLSSTPSFAQENNNTKEAQSSIKEEQKFDPSKLIMEHILDAHEFHFAEIGGHHISIPLPVILYSPQRGFSAFSYSEFNHGESVYNGYKSEEGKIIPVTETGEEDKTVEVYDFSFTRNVVQMLIGAILLVIILIGVAKKYSSQGSQKAPSGFQNAIEPVILFIRDEVGKPNLGHKYEKYMPYLLTVFFFILLPNLIGLIPGTANVTGNIAFTLVLALISLIVILFSTNAHFWGHIFWPPGVPFLVKLILIPVELLGVFIKPAALMIRLFANMVAGHIVITCFVLLIFIFGAMNATAGWGFAPVSIAFTVFIYVIEVLVAFIQAFIFTNLTAVFISQALEGDHHEEVAHH